MNLAVHLNNKMYHLDNEKLDTEEQQTYNKITKNKF